MKPHPILHGENERCFHCNGSGKRRCWKCSGDGMAQCRTCSGTGQIKCYIKLTVTWFVINFRQKCSISK